MIQNVWEDLPNHFEHIELDEFIVMPNHFHGIIHILSRRGESRIRPRPGTSPGTLGRIIQAYKSITSCKYIQGVNLNRWPSFERRLWQRNYHDQIIRNKKALKRIRDYIVSNPANWEEPK